MGMAGINLFIDVLCDEEKFTHTAQEQEILDEIKTAMPVATTAAKVT